MQNIERRLNGVRREIAAAEQKFARQAGSVRLIAVSKTRAAEDVLAAARLGQADFGENYLQEALPKIDALREHRLCWHFIGAIQANKTRLIAAYFDWAHCVYRIKIARRLSAARPPELPPLNVCIQVNISGEETKSGLALEALNDSAQQIAKLPGLRLRGLMAMPALSTDVARQRSAFRALNEALIRLQAAGLALDTLSIGTSTDMAAAIAEGATQVRIGTAIFGRRQT